MTFENQDIAMLAEALRPIVREEIQRALAEHAESLTNPKPWLSEPELANHLGVGPHVVRDARQRGEITGLKIGKQHRYRVSEVEAKLRFPTENTSSENFQKR